MQRLNTSNFEFIVKKVELSTLRFRSFSNAQGSHRRQFEKILFDVKNSKCAQEHVAIYRFAVSGTVNKKH